jgi:DNA polymerase-4
VVARAAWTLLVANEPLDEAHPLRALNVRASDLIHAGHPFQLSLFDKESPLELEALDNVIDDLRHRYGNTVIQRGIELTDTSLAGLDVKRDNVVHPVGFFHV